MIDIVDLLAVADAYLDATGIEDKTLSSRAFDDGKKLTALRSGRDITVGRFNAAMEWFSDNWPEKAVWPVSIPRPSGSREAAE